MGKRTNNEQYKWACVETKFGWVGVAGSSRGLVSLVFPKTSRELAFQELSQELAKAVELDDNAFPDTTDDLKLYFEGQPVHFRAVVDDRLGTPFQKSVWRQIAAIPYGTTISYAELARRIGKPGAARAVGGAVGANPVPIIVPCHRVLAVNAKIGGFGGGIELKRQLLKLEGIEVK